MKIPNCHHAIEGDGFCDDDNNNEGCNWDDGDCCPPHKTANWNGYCEICECLEPTDTPTPTPTTTKG